MAKDNIEKIIKKIIADYFLKEIDEIFVEQDLIKDLKATDFDVIEIVSIIREELLLDLSDEDIHDFLVIKDLVDYIAKIL